jgi:hypothetical protein
MPQEANNYQVRDANSFPPGQANTFPPGQSSSFQPGQSSSFPPGQANSFQPGQANSFQPGQANAFPPGAAQLQQSPYIAANPGAEGYPASFDKHGSLSKFIQNERNAGEFYRGLSNIAPRGYKQYFLDIAHESNIRETELGKLYQNLSGENFIAESRAIAHTKNYRIALERAIREETSAIKEMSGYYEKADEITARKINSILYKKVSDLCYMTHIFALEVKNIK